MNKKSLLPSLTLGVLTVVGIMPSADAQIGRANNTSPFNSDAAWTGGVAPTSAQVAGFSSINTATSGTSTIDAAVDFQIAGITYTNNPGTNLQISGGAGSTLTLGASGIDVSAGTRVLTINNTAPVVLSASQTWTTGTAPDSTSQIVVNSVISGSAALNINGTSGSSLSPVYLNNLNTFTGGVTLNSGASLRFHSGTPTFSLSLPTSSSIGTGNFTINGGTIFGSSGTLAAPTTTIAGNVAINHATSGLNGRLTIGGGTLDLGGETRTVSTGRFATALNSLAGGQESIRFLQTAGAPTISVTNGDLRFVRGSTGTATDFVSVSFGIGSNFAAGSGLTIGENVITTMATGNPFGTTAGAQPHVTVESGGYFNMGDATNARAPQIRSLSGAGTVTSLANSAAPATAALTINSQAGDDTTFSGSIVTGSSLNGTLGTSAANVAVSITKTGEGIQRFSGTNTYAGATTVSAGTLIISSGGSLGASSAVSVASNAQIGGDGTINGDLTLANGARFVFDLNNTPLTVGGTFALNNSFGVASLVQANGSAINWVGVNNGTYSLIATSFVFSAGNITNFGLSNAADLGGGRSAYFTNGSLTLVVIPEPSTYLLISLGLLGVTLLRRRMRRA